MFDKIKKGQVSDIVNMIRENCVDVSLLKDEQNFQQTAMFSACVIKDAESSLAMAKALFDLNVDPKQADSLNQTPLYYAVREGHKDLIDWLVEKGLNLNNVDTYGQTPIFYCIREGHVVTTEKLVSMGGHHDIVDNNGQTPIFYAVKYNKTEMVEYLLGKGINL